MNGINQIKSLVKDFCNEGYIEQQQYDLLLGLGKQYTISANELDKIIDAELVSVKSNQLEKLFRVLNQPDAAVRDKISYYPESNRQFPELLNIGKLRLSINEDVTAFAHIPTSNISGFCLLHDNDNLPILNLAQNIAIRLALSLPAKKFH